MSSPDSIPTAADLLALPEATKRAMVEYAERTHGTAEAKALFASLGLQPSAPPRQRKPASLERVAEGLESEIADLPQVEQGAAREASRRVMARRQPHRSGLSRDTEGNVRGEPEFGSRKAHALRRRDAFGTASGEFAAAMTTQLAMVTTTAQSAGGPDPDETDAMLAAVESVRPENEVEAMLAVQMAATHRAAMTMLARVATAKGPADAQGYGALATKLLRTFPAQVEALAKLRRKGEQTVRVEHVHVYQGGQAIVGHVSPGRGRGGEHLENGHQAHATDDVRTPALAGGAPVRGPDTGGDALPSGRGRGEKTVPNARRGRRKRVSGGT